MKKNVFIGTLHAGLTPHKELKEELERYRPDQLLVEIQQSDIDSGNLGQYPDEMIFALRWAQSNKVTVFGYDTAMNVFAVGKTMKDNEKVIKEQKKLLEGYSWKDANTQTVLNILKIESAKMLVNPDKDKQREELLLANIKKFLDSSKTTVILSGAGHLSFFEKHFPKAIFPFR